MNTLIQNNKKLLELWQEYTEIKKNNLNESAEEKLEEIFDYILNLNKEDCEKFVDFICDEISNDKESNIFSQEFMFKIIVPILEEEMEKTKCIK